jgi:hypothetical protein
MKAAISRILLVSVLVSAAANAFGHHSTAAYDTGTLITIKGIVTSVSWRNPHVRIHVDVPDANGRMINWDVETWGTGQMSLRGLTDGFLKPGDHVSINVFVAKDGSARAFVRHLTLPDGGIVDGPPFDKD